ncbi:MAG: D-2-hydroxyacid dehydrogenase family protein [Candidatus Puniceispirillaceae bacterium]
MKIAIIDDWLNDAPKSANWDQLAAHHQIDFYQDTLTGEALIQRLAPYHIIGIMRERTPFDAALISALPQLKAIVTTGMHNQSIDQEAAKQAGIMVMGTHSPGHATAELAMILIGTLARDLFANATSMTSTGWQVSTGRDLRGATLGILGLGRLGLQLAKFGQAFGMDVQAWSQNLTQDRCDAAGVRFVDKDRFFATSDYISIHLKLSDRVRHLVGKKELAMMKQSACLVNSSRAPIIDTEALIEALQTGQIRAAATDVYDAEPVPSDHIVRQIPNLLCTPHIGYVTEQTMAIFYSEMVETISHYIAGTPIRKFDGF